jgi:hypothetical protein
LELRRCAVAQPKATPTAREIREMRTRFMVVVRGNLCGGTAAGTPRDQGGCAARKEKNSKVPNEADRCFGRRRVPWRKRAVDDPERKSVRKYFLASGGESESVLAINP